MTRPALLLALAALAAVPAGGQDAKFPPPKTLGPVETYGQHLRRSMGLMATSTPEKRNTVRVLFYGQSITEQAWTRAVADDLRKRFPHANFVIENRAIGGHSSQRLWRTAEADLYPFDPDLLVFHVYGSHTDYEAILRRVRERTTADILHTTDHLAARDAVDEPTDPAGLTPKQWEPWFNHAFLPDVTKKYRTELADVRGLWKQYLRDCGLKPQDLLKDGVHLNARGDFLMAELVKAHLRYDPDAKAEPDGRVTTLNVGKEIDWKDGKLTVPFEGNRVVLVCKPGEGKPAAVRIDGKKPSEWAECYAATRATAFPNTNWPVLLRVTSEKPPVAGEWTLSVTELSADGKGGKFTVAGSVTGEDGAGEVGRRFVSPSGRVVIEPEDWNLDYCYQVFKRPLPLPFAVKWKADLRGTDEFASPGVKDPAVETTVTAAAGLPNGQHTLELAGGPGVPVAAVRVYRPTPPGP
ncbi:MAG: hypothetical protein K2X82_29790 [Gemmataceae bacterium]|nr:hypothetical protein [Gemmataceae bacterium]